MLCMKDKNTFISDFSVCLKMKLLKVLFLILVHFISHYSQGSDFHNCVIRTTIIESQTIVQNFYNENCEKISSSIQHSSVPQVKSEFISNGKFVQSEK